MRWTPEQLEAYRKKQTRSCRQEIPPREKALPERMNKLEARYANHLELLLKAGEILHWEYEPFALRLGYRCTYSPDFLVVYPNRVECHETKGGFAREDSIVKFKTAAERFWWMRFVMVFWKNRQWEMKAYGIEAE